MEKMKRTRRKFSVSFKAQVAIEALKRKRNTSRISRISRKFQTSSQPNTSKKKVFKSAWMAKEELWTIFI